MSLRTPKRVAASILKCGVNRVWIDPNRIEDVELAITRDDIRRLIGEGVIKKLRERGIAKKHEKRRKGPGSRKRGIGKDERHEIRVRKVRSLRKALMDLRREGGIKKGDYRKLYRMVKGGLFKSKRDLLRHIETHGLRIA